MIQLIIFDEPIEGNEWMNSFLRFVQSQKSYFKASDRMYFINTDRDRSDVREIVNAIVGKTKFLVIALWTYNDPNPVLGYYSAELWGWIDANKHKKS